MTGSEYAGGYRFTDEYGKIYLGKNNWLQDITGGHTVGLQQMVTHRSRKII